MLNERKGRSCAYDAARRSARIEVGPGGGAGRAASGTALFGKDGGLVGVDVPASTLPPGGRVVVLLGRHEDVARTLDVRLEVSRDAGGEIASIVVFGVDAPG